MRGCVYDASLVLKEWAASERVRMELDQAFQEVEGEELDTLVKSKEVRTVGAKLGQNKADMVKKFNDGLPFSSLLASHFLLVGLLCLFEELHQETQALQEAALRSHIPHELPGGDIEKGWDEWGGSP